MGLFCWHGCLNPRLPRYLESLETFVCTLITLHQLAKLAITLADIATKIPADINWVLQIDGHTDDVPIRAGRYADNWDLSTERALSVVRYLRQQGLPANRLAAAGYGEYQPLDSADNDGARLKNRRIELKITQRVISK